MLERIVWRTTPLRCPCHAWTASGQACGAIPGQRFGIPHKTTPPKIPPSCAPPPPSACDSRFPVRRRYMTASRAIQNGVFNSARILDTRISHIPIFGNAGIAHARFPKTGRKHTSHSGENAREFLGVSRAYPPRVRFCGWLFNPRKQGGNRNRPVPHIVCDKARNKPGLGDNGDTISAAGRGGELVTIVGTGPVRERCDSMRRNGRC